MIFGIDEDESVLTETPNMKLSSNGLWVNIYTSTPFAYCLITYVFFLGNSCGGSMIQGDSENLSLRQKKNRKKKISHVCARLHVRIT